MKLEHGIDIGHRQTDHLHPEFVTQTRGWAYETATSEEVDRLVQLLDQALDEGALGVGLQPAYTPGASREEVFRVFQF